LLPEGQYRRFFCLLHGHIDPGPAGRGALWTVAFRISHGADNHKIIVLNMYKPFFETIEIISAAFLVGKLNLISEKEF